MRKGEPEKIRLGVSACLLGHPVRFDGGHRRDVFLADTLGPFVQWVPVCPEVEIGLGTPRDTIRLEGDSRAPRLVVQRTGEDLTARMQRYAGAKTTELERLGLHGYVLKRASPSCGLLRVHVNTVKRTPSGEGRGLFAAALVERFPSLPIEEEGRLADPAIRENFIERIFATARWQAFRGGAARPRDLIAFHAAHTLAILAHSSPAYAKLGRLVASAGKVLALATLAEYERLFMQALAVRATRARHVNVLQHMAGHVRKQLSAGERQELAELIEQYRRGLVPLIVPLTLISRHVRRLRVADLANQVYLDPYPKELMLRNHG